MSDIVRLVVKGVDGMKVKGEVFKHDARCLVVDRFSITSLSSFRYTLGNPPI